MSAERVRLRIPVPYLIACIVCLMAALIAGLLGDFFTMGVMAFFGVGIIVTTLVAGRPRASDSERISALQYRDERDRVLSIDAFAAVGAVALWQFGIFMIIWSRATRAATIEG